MGHVNCLFRGAQCLSGWREIDLVNRPFAPARTDEWLLRDAKARFSEVVRRAVDQGPRHVSVRGEPAVVVLSEKTFAELTGSHPTILDHIVDAPPWPDDLVEAIDARSEDTGRDVGLTPSSVTEQPGTPGQSLTFTRQ